MSDLISEEYRCFEEIKHRRPNGQEYWLGRELARLLGYKQWRYFRDVVLAKAQQVYQEEGFASAFDFVEVSRVWDAAKPLLAVRDYELSNFACYSLFRVINLFTETRHFGKTYFLIQTYRKEVGEVFNRYDDQAKKLIASGDPEQWQQMFLDAIFDAGLVKSADRKLLLQTVNLGKNQSAVVEFFNLRRGKALHRITLEILQGSERITAQFIASQAREKLNADRRADPEQIIQEVGQQVAIALERIKKLDREELNRLLEEEYLPVEDSGSDYDEEMDPDEDMDLYYGEDREK